MIGIAYFLILWLGVGFLTGFKALFVDQVYDTEFKQELIDSFSPGIMVFSHINWVVATGHKNCWSAEEELAMPVIDTFFII
ncbi:hypothetical protein QNN00_15145 [Bacillus velezensis]|nr:hypothetical protein [Bacillus velezensis]